jgi:hypothetical protein
VELAFAYVLNPGLESKHQWNQDQQVSLKPPKMVAIEVGARGTWRILEPQRLAFGASEMQKLQEIIDTVLGDINQKPGSHAPSDVAMERDRRFAEAASKLEKLRQVRLQAQQRH